MQLSIGGQKISCGETGKGQAVVFLHGWLSTGEIWDIPTFIKQKYHVVTIDLPGHGNVPLTQPLSLSEYAKIVEEVIEKLKLQRPIIVGHSMGGKIAAKLAITNPALVSSLILIASPCAKVVTISRKIKHAIGKVGKRVVSILPLSKARKDQIKQWYYTRIFKEQEFVEASKNEAVKNTFLNLVNEDITKALKKLTVPISIIWGDKDTVLPVEHGAKLRKTIKGSKFYIVNNSGHFPFIDQRKPFYMLLDKIISLPTS